MICSFLSSALEWLVPGFHMPSFGTGLMVGMAIILGIMIFGPEKK
jgi:hypothetical protein